MKTETWSDDEKKLISSFSKITMSQTIETAIGFLEATNWNLEEAINLFLIHSQNQHYWSCYLVEEQQQQQHIILPPLPSFRDSQAEQQQQHTVLSHRYWQAEQQQQHTVLSYRGSQEEQEQQHTVLSHRGSQEEEEQQHTVLSYRGSQEEEEQQHTVLSYRGSQEEEQQHISLPSLPSFRDSKAEPSDSAIFYSLSRRPLVMLFEGSFEDARSFSCRENLWLLVNLRTTTEFASENQDLWSSDAFPLAIETSFIFLQVYDDTTEGQELSSFYKVEFAPSVVLLIDPITGQKMRSWSGEIEAQSFVEDLMKYTDSGPHEYVASLTSNKRIKTEKVCFESSQTNDDVDLSTLWDDDFVPENHSSGNDIVVPSLGEEDEREETCLEFPVLTEEPKEDCDRSLVCTVCIRFPDGRREQRKFLKTEPVQLLWSFCYSHMDASERKAFKLVQAIPGASKTLDYGANATFDQSGIANSIISVT